MVFIAGQEPEDVHGNSVAHHKPADMLIGVARLARPEFLIEVDAIAAK